MKTKKGQQGIIAVIFVCILLIGVILLLGIDMVPANHMGVKVKMGKIIGAMDAGVQWTGLFTSVFKYDLRTRQATVELRGENSAVDKTGQAVYATININYRIKQSHETAINLYKNVGDNDVIADRLNIIPIVREGFKQATVKYEALEILEKRQEVKELAKENIHNNFPKDYFEIQDIVISNIDFSESFKNAIEQKKVAEQTAIKEKNQLEVVKFQQQQEIEKYKAEAEKLRLQGSEISELLVQQQMVAKWNGQLPAYLIMTEDSSGMFMQLPKGLTSE